MATKTEKKTDARDTLDSNEGNELSAIAVKSLRILRNYVRNYYE